MAATLTPLTFEDPDTVSLVSFATLCPTPTSLHHPQFASILFSSICRTVRQKDENQFRDWRSEDNRLRYAELIRKVDCEETKQSTALEEACYEAKQRHFAAKRKASLRDAVRKRLKRNYEAPPPFRNVKRKPVPTFEEVSRIYPDTKTILDRHGTTLSKGGFFILSCE